VVHFIGRVKPWNHIFNRETRRVELQPDPRHDASYLQQWWEIYVEHVEPQLAGRVVISRYSTLYILLMLYRLYFIYFVNAIGLKYILLML